MRYNLRSVLARSLPLLWMVICLNVPNAGAQSYLSSVGQPTFTTPEPVELGFVESANGHLHLEVPIGSFAQRGTPDAQTYRLVYDSYIWNIVGNGFSQVWSTSPPTPIPSSGAGWRLVTSTGSRTFYTTDTTSSSCAVSYKNFGWQDSAGNLKYFAITTTHSFTGCSAQNVTSGNAYATDSSGYRMYVTNYLTATVYAPDGTIVTSSGPDAQGHYIGAKDANGNYISSQTVYGTNSNVTSFFDTVGRTSLTYTDKNCTGANQGCFDVSNSAGGTSRYTITTTTIPLKTHFAQSGVIECTVNCTTQVIQSITLPDNTSFNFLYDCDSSTGNLACGSPSGQAGYYGVLTNVSLPTGGQIGYQYKVFSDSYSNAGLWVSSKTSAGGTWTYTPQVITTCTSTQVGCQQKLTVTKPFGDTTVYTFTLNNGAWPTQIQNYSGGVLALTTNETYDFANACPFTGCHGAAYIRRTVEKTSIPTTAGGTLTKQVTLTYDSPQKGNVTAVKEWKFLSGTAPSFPAVPDRATYRTYATIGLNIISRPVTVVVCSNAGSDSECGGSGTKVSKTTSIYDAYGTGGIAQVLGTPNHDDTGFGVGLVARGNPTSVAHWVNSTTTLTNQISYDMTGQVTKTVDPAGNITTYGYADSFYDDNGSNPPASHSVSQATNAYPTRITTPIGSVNFGYYYGSGSRALSSDLNGVTSYFHFQDPFDRPTKIVTSSGWALGAYSAANQYDSYTGIADASPSAGCTSCRHNQTQFDSWGRTISEKLVNAPLGTVSVDTTYDAAGRVESKSHPYASVANRVFETFTYDGLSRQVQVNHPDGQFVHTAFAANVTSAGGITAQLGPTSTYGFGLPSVTVDESGKQIQRWSDGFGRVIEVDEPGASGSSSGSATAGSGSVTINGSEGYSGPVAATSGTGTVVISGAEGTYTFYPCGVSSCPTTGYDSGTVSVTVNGFTASASYGQNSTRGSVASSLANSFNGNGSSPVTATATTANVCQAPSDTCVLNLTTKATGTNTAYTISTSSATSVPQHFSSASFWASPVSSTMTPGQAAQPAQYDAGTVQVNVNGFQVSATYSQTSTPSSLVATLANGFSSLPGSPVTATVSGATVTLTATQAGLNTNYSLVVSSSTNYPSRFPAPSFVLSPSGGALSGGSDGTAPTISNPTGTFYVYDAADNLVQVVQGVQTRSYSYDYLSRVTSTTTPEAGTENFYYTTAAGGLCSGDPSSVCRHVDSRGVTTTFSYDSMSRLVGRSYQIPNGTQVAAMPGVCVPAGTTLPSQNVCLNYDQGGAASFALGRLTQLIDPSGSESLSYDSSGRVTQVQKTISSQTYTTAYQYNVADEVTQIRYPSGRTVNRSYDSVGKLTSIADSSKTYVSIPSGGYNAADQILTLNYGNGVVGSFAYSPARSQLTSLSYSNTTKTLFSLNLWYAKDANKCTTGSIGNNGQIQCTTDNVDPGRSVAYTYDFLGRVSSALTTGSANYSQWGLSWSYDRYGNRLAQTLTAGGAPTNSLSFANPGGAQTNRPDGMCFDAAGNLLAETNATCPPAVPTYIYDAENRLVNYQNAAYVYDSNGLRVKKTAGGTTTAYVFSSGSDIAEYDNGAAPAAPSREYVYMGAQLVATLNGGATPTVFYHHSDQLSVRVTTDGTPASPNYGKTIGEQGHYPFGSTWYASNTTSKFIFTSYERDSESQNDYALARFYLNRLGRFCSADPVLGSPEDPQSWNRYAYVRNDPVNKIDPSGQFAFLAFLVQLIFSFLNGLFFHTWFQGITGQHITFGLSPMPNFSLPTVAVVGTPPTFPNGGPIDWHTMMPGYSDKNLLIIQNFQNVSVSTDPCAGVDPGDFDYSQVRKYGKGKNAAVEDAEQHIKRRHINPLTAPGASKYELAAPYVGIEGTFQGVKNLNGYTFQNPLSKTRLYDANGKLTGFRFTAYYPIQSPHPTYGKGYVGAWLGTDATNNGQHTLFNTLYLAADCKTVQTSHPGLPGAPSP